MLKPPPPPPDPARTDLIARTMIWAVTFGLIALVGRVIQLQLFPSPRLAGLIDTQYSKKEIQDRRGGLYDREGRLISGSDTYYRLYVDPTMVGDVSEFADRLHHAFGYDPAAVERKIHDAQTRTLVLDADFSAERAAKLSASPLQGLSVQTRPRTLTAAQRNTVAQRDRIIRDAARRGRPVNQMLPPMPAQTVDRLVLSPAAVDNPDAYARRVAAALGYDTAWTEKAAKSIKAVIDTRFVVIDDDLSEARREILRASPLAGVAVEMRQERQYPQGHLAGPVIGFVGFDHHGLEGLERRFDKYLTGKPGELAYLRDAARNPIWIEQAGITPASDGRSFRISIDATIQGIVESELNKVCRDYSAESGQIVVMDPVTGEVLAMANFPSSDPNLAGAAPAELRRNRCVTDIFEPGSIYKPVVWSSAIQLGYAKPTETIDCTSGACVMRSGRTLHDAHGNGTQTWDGVLIKSSNIGMGKIGERIGSNAMFYMVRGFGFGQSTGSGFPGESTGILNPLPRWTSYSVTSIPMGQEIGVTPLQMVRAYCVFANGGYLLQPTFLAVADRNHLPPDRILGRVLTPDVAYHTKQTLRQVVLTGTAQKIKGSNYAIWGKTGTAQIPDRTRGGYESGGYVASFIGGAPLDRPQVIIGCFIHHPDPAKGHYGGLVSAPPVRNIVEQILPYLGIPPDNAQSGPAQDSRNPADARE